MADLKCNVFQGLPREGKSHAGLRILSEATTGIYLSAKHEIVDQSFERFHCPDYKTAVKMEGKGRLCNTKKFDCSRCRMKPDENDPDHIGYFELMEISESLLQEHPKLSEADVESAETESIRKKYGGLCKYYTLKFAMERSNYVFTVPQIHVPKERVELLVVDEDPTLAHYFPQPTEICSFMHLPLDSSVHIDIPDFQFIVDEIEQKPRKLAVDWDVIKAICTLEAWKKSLVSFKADIFKDDEDENKIDQNKIIETLNKIPVPVFEDRDAAYAALYKRLVGDDRSGVFDAVFYPAPIRFYLEKGKYKNTIFAIADSEHQVREFPPSERILFIGATLAEKIAGTLYPGKCVVREFKSFSFAKNFATIPVKDVSKVSCKGQEYERGSREKTQKFLLAIAETLTRHNVPSLMVTGSERVQGKVESDLSDMRVSSLACKKETREEMDNKVLLGVPIIIYANGSSSRGIDLDIFDVTIFYHADYSTPYWSAMESYWKSNDDEKSQARAREYAYIREQILIDETVNLAFRIAPVKGCWEGYPKILFIPEYYLERIRTRCEKMNVDEILESAISEHTFTPQNVDLKNLGAELGAQIRTVIKTREKGEKIPELNSDGFEQYELSYYSNQYPDLPPNAPILGAVREGRLVEFLNGLVLKDTEGLVQKPEIVPAYLEPLIRDLVLECIRTQHQRGGNAGEGVPTMDIIRFVQNPPAEWISTYHAYAVLPDSRDKLGRPQKYLATREQIRSFLKRMESDGELTCYLKGRKQFWSLPKEIASAEMTETAAPVTEEGAHA